MKNQSNEHTRRGFLNTLGLGGLSLAGMAFAPIEEQLEYTTQKVSRNSAPSDLKITD